MKYLKSLGYVYLFIGALHGIAAIIGSRFNCGWFCDVDISGIEYFLVTVLWPFKYF